MIHLIRKYWILVAVGLMLYPAGQAGQIYPFNDCGLLVEGPEGTVLFAPMHHHGDMYILENYGEFSINDEVCVSGDLDFSCMFDTANPGDTLSFFPCIVHNSIDSADSPSFPFNGNGVLFQGVTCLLFESFLDGQIQLFLDNYEDFTAGDTVFVSGMVHYNYTEECSDSVACLANNVIEEVNQPPVPVRGRAVVGLEPGNSAIPFFAMYNIIPRDSIPYEYIYLVEYNDTLGMESIISILSSDSRVIFVEPNLEFSFPGNLQMSMSFPDESRPPLILGTSPPGYYDQAANYIINVDSAHQLASGEGITVAVIDNGVEFSHPLLDEYLLHTGYDFLDDDADPGFVPGLAGSHGTFVSGLVLLTAPDCRILPLRAFDEEGIGNSFAIIQSIYYAINAGVDVINMSFGMNEYNQSLAIACSTAIANDIVIVAAAGNDGTMAPMYPAALEDVIAVSAVDSMDYITSFSNFGSYIDICAPGDRVYSSLAGEYRWGTWSGTSFSTAMVSATCAMVLELNEALSPSDLEYHIRLSAERDLHGETIYPPDFFYGYGRLDAGEAIWSLGILPMLCGDINEDETINIADAVFLIDYIFHGGTPPGNFDIADANCDGNVNVGDVIHIINYIFKSGAQPCCGQ